jgi:low affinity Fe/Cu permease
MTGMRELFRKFSRACADAVGSPWAFFVAVFVCGLWALTGPIYGYSDTWQLVINTATTIVTFLMVFLIQNTQNRDAKAIHLKLDELLRAVKGARTGLVHLEELSDQELEALTREFERLHLRAAERLRRQGSEAGEHGEPPSGQKNAA